MYYMAAREGIESNLRVTYSTRRDAEGRKLDDLAEGNQADVSSVLKGIQEAKRRANRPIHLVTRGSESNNTSSQPTPPIGVTNPPLPPLPLPDANPRTQAPEPPQGPPSSGPPDHNPNQDRPHE